VLGGREGRRTGEAGEQRGAEAVDVGRLRGRSAHEHLGRCVRHGGVDRPRHRRRGIEQPGDAEVRELCLAVRREQHVVGLHVAVQDAGLVGRRQRPGELGTHRGDLRRRQGPRPAHPVPQRALGEVGHHDVGAPVVGHAAGVGSDDVRVVRQPAHGRDLPSPPIGVGGVLDAGGQDLDGDVPPELPLVAPVHDAVAATADGHELLDAGHGRRGRARRRVLERHGRGRTRPAVSGTSRGAESCHPPSVCSSRARAGRRHRPWPGPRGGRRAARPRRPGGGRGRRAGTGGDPGRGVRAARGARGAGSVPHVLRARPRPRPPQPPVPSPGGQVPGLHRPGRRPPPHPHDARHRGGAGGVVHRPGRPAERRADHGSSHRARLRPRPRRARL
jgi:hypothetical protein